MIATMDRNGVITLSPENGIEAFALQIWANASAVQQDDQMRNEKFKWRSSALVVNLTIPDKP